MRLSSVLTSIRLFGELARAGVISDESTVNRVVIDARRGSVVVIHVELVSDTGTLSVIREAPLLDGLKLDPPGEEPAGG